MATHWLCSYCTLENENSLSQCEVCQHPKPDTNTDIPPPTDTDNQQNQTPISKDDNKNNTNTNTNTNDTDSKWQCERCTLYNELSATLCTTCGQTKPVKPTNNSWKCSVCTYSNQPIALKCLMCDSINTNINTSNNNKNNNIKTIFIWEWKGGNKWYEYSDEISNKIHKSYNNGIIKIDLNLSNGNYMIDLSKLQQINNDTQKVRKIRCVKYEQSNNDINDIKMDENNKQTDEWTCNECTMKNLMINTHCEICKTERNDIEINDKQEKSPSVNSDNTKQLKHLSLNNTLMDLSSDDDDNNNNNNNNKNKKKNTKKTNKKAKTKKKKEIKTDSNQPTLLNMFAKENNGTIPKPLGPLKKTKKRKLSDIINDENDKTPKKKKQKTDISAKYLDKYGGSVLNKDLIDALWELSMIERNSGNKFKANAYSKACKALKECGVKITSGKEAQNKLKGVGKKIAAKIDELLETGHLKKLDKLRADDTIQGINQLCQIHGIGPKKASELVKEHRIMTIEELRQKGKHLLNTQQKLGLKYFEYINKRIPREQCTKIGEIVRNILDSIDKNIIMNICGSYRRGKKDCGDVDILLTHIDNKYDQKRYSKQLLIDIVRKLKDNKLLVDDLAHGPVKYMGICRYEENIKKKTSNEKELPDSIPNNFKIDVPSFEDVDMDEDIILNDNSNSNDNNNTNNNANEFEGYDENENGKRVYFRRIDLKFISYKFYYANLLYFTGSDRLNVDMRLKANEKQLILNENGVYKMLDEDDHSKKSKDPIIHPKSEKDIFDAIGMDYIEPKDRSW